MNERGCNTNTTRITCTICMPESKSQVNSSNYIGTGIHSALHSVFQLATACNGNMGHSARFRSSALISSCFNPTVCRRVAYTTFVNEKTVRVLITREFCLHGATYAAVILPVCPTVFDTHWQTRLDCYQRKCYQADNRSTIHKSVQANGQWRI